MPDFGMLMDLIYIVFFVGFGSIVWRVAVDMTPKKKGK